jgi:hypothetical protein
MGSSHKEDPMFDSLLQLVNSEAFSDVLPRDRRQAPNLETAAMGIILSIGIIKFPLRDLSLLLTAKRPNCGGLTDPQAFGDLSPASTLLSQRN